MYIYMCMHIVRVHISQCYYPLKKNNILYGWMHPHSLLVTSGRAGVHTTVGLVWRLLRFPCNCRTFHILSTSPPLLFLSLLISPSLQPVPWHTPFSHPLPFPLLLQISMTSTHSLWKVQPRAQRPRLRRRWLWLKDGRNILHQFLQTLPTLLPKALKFGWVLLQTNSISC